MAIALSLTLLLLLLDTSEVVFCPFEQILRWFSLFLSVTNGTIEPTQLGCTLDIVGIFRHQCTRFNYTSTGWCILASMRQVILRGIVGSQRWARLGGRKSWKLLQAIRRGEGAHYLLLAGLWCECFLRKLVFAKDYFGLTWRIWRDPLLAIWHKIHYFFLTFVSRFFSRVLFIIFGLNL